MSRKHKTPYEEIKEYVSDYLEFMEKINAKRLRAAEKEVVHVMNESKALNMLKQNMDSLEAYGVS